MPDIAPRDLVNTSITAGWVRALVAALLSILVSKFPGLSSVLPDTVREGISVAVSTGLVGWWSQYVKKWPPRTS